MIKDKDGKRKSREKGKQEDGIKTRRGINKDSYIGRQVRRHGKKEIPIIKH